jgi:hypothetical protein
MALALSIACVGCGTQATIVLKDGNTVHGRIVENRYGTIVAENQSGVFEVSESQVSDIKHPGTAAMIVGGSLVVLGSLLLASGALTDCSGDQKRDWLGDDCELGRIVSMIHGGAGATAGVGVGAFGLGVKAASQARARKPSEEDPLDWPTDMRTFGVVGRF